MTQTILDELRQQGKYVDFVERLQELYQDIYLRDEVNEAFARHFLSGTADGTPLPCLLLEAARSQPSTTDFYSTENAGVKSIDQLSGLWHTNASQTLLNGRLKLIAAARSAEGDKAIRDLLRQAAGQYRKAWGHKESRISAYHNHGAEPGFLHRLPPRWGQVLLEFARQAHHSDGRIDWDDPLLLMIGETLVYLLVGDSTLPSEGSSVSTWVPLLAHLEVGSRSVPEGLLARLVVEKVSNGGGYLYPDCRYTGYLQLDAVFQEALYNVMEVIRRRPEWLELQGSTFDFRWRLTLTSPLDSHRDPVLVESLTGRSAELSFAAAIMASLRGERLDERIASSGCFASPAAHEKSEREKLSGVDGIVGKVLGTRTEPAGDLHREEHCGHEFKGNLIDCFLVSTSTTSRTEFQIYGWRISVVQAQTLDEAYRRLSVHCQTTDKIKKHLAERARRLLATTCSPYIRSSLSTRRPGDPSKQEPREVPDPLSAEQVEQLLRGNLGQQNRVRLLGESGLGKSTMLIEAEHLIASSPDSLVPLRLGAGPADTGRDDLGRWIRLPLLSDFDWSMKQEDLFDELAGRLLGDVIEDRTVRTAWLHEAVGRGEVVFLLDSLDQTKGELDLSSFVKSDGVRKCPVLLSMRPAARFSQSWKDAGGAWRTYWMEPFDEHRIRQYWGHTPGLWNLLSKKDWAAVREVPILLQQMKILAENGELDNVPNREALYDRTLSMLLQHGHSGLRYSGEQQISRHSLPRVQKLLAEIAWNTINLESSSQQARESNFTGELSGEDYLKFEEQHGDLLAALDQLNLTTRQAYLDVYGLRHEQFVWRHLSFCEWFAGLHLVSLDPQEQEAIVQRYALDPRWGWIFRFAVCAASRLDKQDTVGHLAKCLLSYGAAFLLYSIRDKDFGDGCDFGSMHNNIADLCIWLIARSSIHIPDPHDLPRELWAPFQGPLVDSEVVAILEKMFELYEDTLVPKHRDSRWLYSAWDLVQKGCQSQEKTIRLRCESIRVSFLSEFERRVVLTVEENQEYAVRDWSSANRGILQLVPDEYLADLGVIDTDTLALIRHWPDSEDEEYQIRRDSFHSRLHELGANYCKCPPHGWAYLGCPSANNTGHKLEDDAARSTDGNWLRRLPLHYLMMRKPVTNAQFAAFDPNHCRTLFGGNRDFALESHFALEVQDDQPVVMVNWYQAEMFTIWLTGQAKFGHFSLPSSFEWETCNLADTVGGDCESGRPLIDHYDPLYDWFSMFLSRGFEESDEFKKRMFWGSWECTGIIDDVSQSNLYKEFEAALVYPVNGFGLCDMRGKVWEWTKDFLSLTPVMQGDPEVAQMMKLKGGEWWTRWAEASYRDPSERYAGQWSSHGKSDTGFRVCVNLY